MLREIRQRYEEAPSKMISYMVLFLLLVTLDSTSAGSRSMIGCTKGNLKILGAGLTQNPSNKLFCRGNDAKENVGFICDGKNVCFVNDKIIVPDICRGAGCEYFIMYECIVPGEEDLPGHVNSISTARCW